jgi:peptide/nickel transport system permease protein
MAKYIVKRLFLGVLTVLAIALVMFLFQTLVPDKPYDDLIRGTRGNPERIAAIRARYGADDPFFLSFLKFVKLLAKPLWSWFYDDDSGTYRLALPSGPDFGTSPKLHETVWSSITQRIGATGELMICSYILTLLIAVPVGIVSAVKQYSKLDNAVTSLSFVGISLPNYWFGTILIYAFAIFPVQHGYGEVFPVGGQHANGIDSGILDLAWHLALPVVVLAVQSIASYARFIRASMLEALNQDYIRTARAKGLADRRVVVRHAFRNSLLPFITLMGLDIPQLFVGAVITEVVFNWPGMGQLFVNSAGTSDFPILIGIAVLLSVFVVLGNLIADLAYTWADPRISYT